MNSDGSNGSSNGRSSSSCGRSKVVVAVKDVMLRLVADLLGDWHRPAHLLRLCCVGLVEGHGGVHTHTLGGSHTAVQVHVGAGQVDVTRAVVQEHLWTPALS